MADTLVAQQVHDERLSSILTSKGRVATYLRMVGDMIVSWALLQQAVLYHSKSSTDLSVMT